MCNPHMQVALGTGVVSAAERSSCSDSCLQGHAVWVLMESVFESLCTAFSIADFAMGMLLGV